jgi:hypothetical protein
MPVSLHIVHKGMRVGYTHIGQWHGYQSVALPEKRKADGSTPPLTPVT